ncbi:MAG: HAD family hydrolase [Pseudorhodobacter sp.]
MFDAVIFDLDGTLLDTESGSHMAAISALARLDAGADPEFLRKTAGVDDITTARMIRTHYPHIDHETFFAIWKEETIKTQTKGIPTKPGAWELLEAIRQPIVLATSSRRVDADRKLSIARMGHCFAYVVTCDDVTAPKPAPEPYLLAARLVGVDPARCLAFEDSDTGAESAHRAGMTVVQVPDINPSAGHFANLLAGSLLEGARQIGLLPSGSLAKPASSAYIGG